MDISELVASREDQERGTWFDLRHPVTGAPIDIRFKVAGPDSETQRDARLKMEQALFGEGRRYEPKLGKDRERLVVEMLARCVIDLDARENGEPVPHTFLTVVRMIEAALWVRAQLDDFAADRRPYFAKPDVETDLPEVVDAQD